MSAGFTKFCHACGQKIDQRAEICPHCGVRQPGTSTPPFSDEFSDARSKKIAAGICGILIGALGIHKFILGMTGPGLVMLLVTVLTLGLGGIVMSIIGLIEGIIYLTKSDEEFYEIYYLGRKSWF